MTKKSPTQKMPGVTTWNARNYTALSPRLQRLLQQLLRKPQAVRELIDSVGATNVPEYVRQLRQQYYFVIPTERVTHIDRDGNRGWHCTYSLTRADRLLAIKLLGGA
jgi:hypothetical protein